MTQMRECVEKLAVEINARPAGTDEEQSAAIYIQEQFSSKTNLDVEMEEFQTSFLGEMFRSIAAGVVFLAGLLAIVFPPAIIASIVLAILGGAIYVLDALSIFKLSSIIGKSPTQNVVAKYKPQAQSHESKRSRKIVLITNYDSERIRSEVSGGIFQYLGFIKIAELVCVVVVFLVLLLNLFFGANLFFTILLVVGCVGSVLPLVSFIFHQTAQYNQGANNNAASVAVMLDVARRISSGLFTSKGEVPIVHGKSAAERAGVIPQDAEVEWESDGAQADGIDKQRAMVSSVMSDLNGETSELSAVEPSSGGEVSSTMVDSAVAISNSTSGPDWFSRGVAKANGGQSAPKSNTGVRRSTYGDALQNANNRLAGGESVDAPSEHVDDVPKTDLERKLEAIHDNIERASSDAARKAKEDVETAERVLDSEIKEQEDLESQRKESVAGAIPSIAAQREPEITLRPAEETRAGVTGLLEAVTENPDYETTRTIEPVVVEERSAVEQKNTSTSRSPIDERLAARSASANVQKPAQTVKRDIQLPSLTGAIEAHNSELKEKSEKEKEKSRIQARDEKLGIVVPSLDSSSEEAPKAKNEKVASAGAFGVGEATGTFAPITDELVAGLSEEETYVLDADDTIYEEQATESGAVAGPGYVDIPETRTESVFGKIFNRKKKKAETEISFREAYDVDEDFDAREVGKKRGDWKSFAQDDDEWNGGMAISGGSVDEEHIEQSRDDIFSFADHYIDREVWFVALGAEYADHAGSKKFFEMHSNELKGAIFIVLDGLGAGVTALVEKDGVLRPKPLSPRMKRIARASAKSAGIELETTSMTWTDSTASVVGAEGFSCIHIAGVESGKPALLSSKEDVSDNVEDEILLENSNYVMEIVRSI